MRRCLFPLLLFAAAGCAAQVHHVDIGIMTAVEISPPRYYHISESKSSSLISPCFGAYLTLPLSPVVLVENELLYNRYNMRMTDEYLVAATQHITCIADAVMIKAHKKKLAFGAGLKLLKPVRSVRSEKEPAGSRDYNQTGDFKPFFIMGLFDIEYAFPNEWYLFTQCNWPTNLNALKNGEKRYYDDNSMYTMNSFQIGIKKRLYRWRNIKYYQRIRNSEYY